jgi:hypothetical protein
MTQGAGCVDLFCLRRMNGVDCISHHPSHPAWGRQTCAFLYVVVAALTNLLNGSCPVTLPNRGRC